MQTEAQAITKQNQMKKSVNKAKDKLEIILQEAKGSVKKKSKSWFFDQLGQTPPPVPPS